MAWNCVRKFCLRNIRASAPHHRPFQQRCSIPSPFLHVQPPTRSQFPGSTNPTVSRQPPATISHSPGSVTRDGLGGGQLWSPRVAATESPFENTSASHHLSETHHTQDCCNVRYRRLRNQSEMRAIATGAASTHDVGRLSIGARDIPGRESEPYSARCAIHALSPPSSKPACNALMSDREGAAVNPHGLELLATAAVLSPTRMLPS